MLPAAITVMEWLVGIEMIDSNRHNIKEKLRRLRLSEARYYADIINIYIVMLYFNIAEKELESLLRMQKLHT